MSTAFPYLPAAHSHWCVGCERHHAYRCHRFDCDNSVTHLCATAERNLKMLDRYLEAEAIAKKVRP